MTTEKGAMIARGRTAEIFSWQNDQVLKLFLDWCPTHYAEYEARITQAIHEAGLPVPKIEGTIEIDGRLGVIFQRVEGSSMLKDMLSKPWKLVPSARQLADLHMAIHSCEVSGLPSQRQQLENAIRGVPTLPANTKQAVLDALAELPDGSLVCHGDYHPDNIIMSSSGPIIIDWLTATQGNALADVARTWLLLGLGEPLPGTPMGWLIKLVRRSFLSIYLKRYLQLRPASRQQIVAWQLPIMAARLAENIPEEEQRLLALIETYLNSRDS